jgi:hypothetical protein
MGNNAFAVMFGIGTCKLDLQGDHTLYLHNVLYAPEVQQNLVYVLALLQLGFYIVFLCEKYMWIIFFMVLVLY